MKFYQNDLTYSASFYYSNTSLQFDNGQNGVIVPYSAVFLSVATFRGYITNEIGQPSHRLAHKKILHM